MKKIMTTIGLGLMIALITPTFAQDGKKGEHKKEHKKDMSPEEKAQKKADKMKAELGLTDEQTKQVYEINLKHINAMKPIHEEMKKVKDKAKAERQKTKAELDKVLTDEQKEKAEDIRKAKKGKHKGQGGPKAK